MADVDKYLLRNKGIVYFSDTSLVCPKESIV